VKTEEPPEGAVIVPKPLMESGAPSKAFAFERSAICLRGLFVGLNVELDHPTAGRDNTLCRRNRSVDIAQYGCVCTRGDKNKPEKPYGAMDLKLYTQTIYRPTCSTGFRAERILLGVDKRKINQFQFMQKLQKEKSLFCYRLLRGSVPGEEFEVLVGGGPG